MQINFSDILDIHKNKTAIIMANGPSTKPFLPHFQKVSKQKDKYVTFVCNEIDEMLENVGLKLVKDIDPDYWVISSTVLTVASRYNNFNLLQQNGGKLLYANSTDLTKNVDELLKIDYLSYDQRHFDNKHCPVPPELGCCEFCKDLIPSRLTIQEELQKYTGYDKHYGTASTVALHMLAFAILMGCKKIYLSGIDLNYNLGYFDRKTQNPDTFKLWLGEILEDFRLIKNSAELKNVEIINLSKISPLKDIFITKE
jgi:hypothetical protein